MKNFKYKSQEAYFGKESGLGAGMEEYITQIGEFFKEAKSKGANELKQIAKSKQEEIEKILNSFESFISNHLNVERTYISLISDVNAMASPMYFDDDLVKVDNLQIKILSDDKFRITGGSVYFDNFLEAEKSKNISITSKGYKFNDPKNKSILLFIGLGLYDIMSYEEITGVMLHELGHSMQHMVLQMSTNFIMNARKSFLRNLIRSLQPLERILAIIKNVSPLQGLIEISELLLVGFNLSAFNAINKMEKEAGGLARAGKRLYNIAFQDIAIKRSLSENPELLPNGAKVNYKNVRTEYGETSKETSSKMIAKILNDINLLKGKSSPIYIIFNAIRMQIKRIGLLSFYLVFPIIRLLDFIGFSLYSGRKQRDYINFGKKAEEFADTFATFYGYGKELSSGLRKISGQKADFGLFNFVHAVPGLNMWIAYGRMKDMSIQQELFGYPKGTEVRIANIYKTLDFELKNNNNLSNSQKIAIRNQMEEVKKEYEYYVYTDGGIIKSLGFSLLKIITKKSIENESGKDLDEFLEFIQFSDNELKKKSFKDHDEFYYYNPTAKYHSNNPNARINNGVNENIKANNDSKAAVSSSIAELRKDKKSEYLKKLSEQVNKYLNIGVTNKGVESFDILGMANINVFVGDKHYSYESYKKNIIPGKFEIEDIEIAEGTKYGTIYLRRKRT